MTPAELLDNLAIEQVESTSFLVLSYEDTDPMRAQLVANTVGRVSSELISERRARSPSSQLTATVYEEARVPLTPVSPKPLRNGILAVVMGLMLCVGLVVALPRVAGKLGRPAVPPGVGQAGVLGGALDRRGKLTAVEAALETSLSVEEAERMLQALAAKGHLRVTIEHGRLVYALWKHRAPQ
jgi:hypothetical protein